jgi:hypothetical protein
MDEIEKLLCAPNDSSETWQATDRCPTCGEHGCTECQPSREESES